jgi:hypothetical protein
MCKETDVDASMHSSRITRINASMSNKSTKHIMATVIKFHIREMKMPPCPEVYTTSQNTIVNVAE